MELGAGTETSGQTHHKRRGKVHVRYPCELFHTGEDPTHIQTRVPRDPGTSWRRRATRGGSTG
eukprot:1430879-Pyramimonas_sp.AAC.1